MKLAAIDIGSNSVHMIIVEVGADGSFRVMDREREMIGLGRGTLERNFLDEKTMAAGRAALGKFGKLARRHGVEEILAVATSAVREALNGGDFIEQVRRETGIDVRVITAIEEARLIGLAVRDGIDVDASNAMVIDMGGGSIETILLERGKVAAAESYKLGVIRLAERFLAAGSRFPRSARRELVDHVRTLTRDFVELARKTGFEQVIGTSGTILALGALADDLRPDAAQSDLLNGRAVSFESLQVQADLLADMTARERAHIPGLDARRADTIVVGASALVEILGRLGADELILCDRALREGILVDYLEQNRARLGRHGELGSLRHRSVLELAERYGYDARHASQVSRAALLLFDRTRGLHGLGDGDRRLLEFGAILHDVGTHIAFTGHHRHGYYLVKNGGLRGFRPDEVEFLAGLVLYHRKRNPKKTDPCMRAVGRKRGRALCILAGILRIADGLDRSHFQVVRNVAVRVTDTVVSIYVDAEEDSELEVWAADRKGQLFARELGVDLRFVLKKAPGRRGAAALPAVTGPMPAGGDADSTAK